MALDFPAAPTVGATYASAGVVWVFDGVKWVAGPSQGGYLPLSGGQLTGNLVGTNAAFSGQVSGASGNISGALSVGGLATALSPPALDSSNDLATTSWVQGLLSGWTHRNRLINGGFLFDQRNNRAAITPTGTQYVADRWVVIPTQASKFSAQVLAWNTAYPSGVGGAISISTPATPYAPVAADAFTLNQPIEFANVADLNWGRANASPVVLSFWALATVAGTYAVAVQNTGGTRSYIATYTLPTNAWTYVSIPIPGDTQGTWYTAFNAVSIYVRFDLGAGATYIAPAANVWLNGVFMSVAPAVKLVANASATFYLANVQLEAGTIASPFDLRSYGAELALCQRYFQTGTLMILAYSSAVGGQFGNSLLYGVPMRASPTLTPSAYSPSINGSSITLASQGPISFQFYCAATAAGSINVQGSYSANAEL